MLTLRQGLFYLRLVFVAYGSLVWYFYLRLKFGLVFFAYGGKSVWYFFLRFTPVQKWDLIFFAYGSPTVSKKDKP